MALDAKGLEAAKAEGYALGVHEGRVELIVRAYLSALSPAMLVDMGSGRRWMTPALSSAGTASEMERVASCPGCSGTGNAGGNPLYGDCDDCGGTGFVSAPRRIVDVPDIKFVIADYLELRDEAMGFDSDDAERSESATELHDAIQAVYAKLASPAGD